MGSVQSQSCRDTDSSPWLPSEHPCARDPVLGAGGSVGAADRVSPREFSFVREKNKVSHGHVLGLRPETVCEGRTWLGKERSRASLRPKGGWMRPRGWDVPRGSGVDADLQGLRPSACLSVSPAADLDLRRRRGLHTQDRGFSSLGFCSGVCPPAVPGQDARWPHVAPCCCGGEGVPPPVPTWGSRGS